MKSHETDEKGQKEILVVEDSYDSLYLLTSILEGHGYQVRPASDGYLALRTMAVQVPDLILLDVKMPGMDGYEVCRRLKSEEKTRKVPVIFISALDETTDKVQGFEAGGVDFITKPFEAEEVLARVGTHLQLRKLTECLEKEVRKQTRELEDINKQLRQEINDRTLTEKALRESEQKLVNIIDFYPDATFVINQKGEVISWNNKIEAMTGVQAGDILGKGNYEYALPFHGERRPILIDLVLHRNEDIDIKKIEKKYAYINRDGQQLIGETHATHLKGKKYYLMATCAPLYDPNGNITGAIESIRDITERKQAEEEIKRSQAKYMDLYENAPDMYVSVNAKTALIEDCNLVLANTLGYSKEEIIGRPIFDIYHPDCLEEVKETSKLFVETGKIHDKELQLRRKDGSKIDVSLNVSSVRGEDGLILYSRLTLRDITERKRNSAINSTRLHLMQFAVTHSLDEFIEETLNEAEKLTDSLIGFYCFVEDDQKSLAAQNWSAKTKAQFCKAEGKGMHYPVAEAGVWVDCIYQQKPVIHNDYASLPHRKGMPEGHAELIRELVVPVLRGKKTKAILGVGNKPTDYTEKDVESISLLADLAWEIAKRKQAELALQKAHGELEAKVMDRTTELTAITEKAREASQAKSEFLASMSHELRTPLNAILGYAYILKQSNNLTDEQKKHLKAIHLSGKHLLTLIDDILDLSCIEAGKTKMESKAFSLRDLISGVINVARIKAKQKNLFVNFQNDTSLPPVLIGDERKLRQVLLNLLDNAVKYTEQGGVTLRVSTDKHPSSVEKHTIPPQTKPGHPSSDNRKLALRIEIEDTGPGISEEKIKTIFEPFKRFRSNGSDIEGIGLGLAISRRMVEMMGGSLLAQSAIGKGSLFTVLLSLDVSESADVLYTPLDMIVEGYTGERKRLLVVDDDITNLSVLISLLDPLDFEIETAESGEMALAKAKTAVPDLVLLDLLMPNMDGIETIHKIKADERLKTTKIIGVSAAVADKSLVDIFAEMCDDFVSKPIDPISLLSKIKVQLQLEWIECDKTSATPAMDQKTTIKIPPREILEEILKRLKRGEISRLEQIVLALENDDETYTAFCAKIMEYLDYLDENSIIKLISLGGRLDG